MNAKTTFAQQYMEAMFGDGEYNPFYPKPVARYYTGKLSKAFCKKHNMDPYSRNGRRMSRVMVCKFADGSKFFNPRAGEPFVTAS